MRVTMKYEINRVRVANEIKEIRLSLGLTMEDFANKLGVAKGTVNNYEKGRILPGESVIRKIISLSNDTEMSVNDFLYGSTQEYLEDIFFSIEDWNKFNNSDAEWLKTLDILGEELSEQKLRFGDERSIILRALELDSRLKYSRPFLELCNEYRINFKYDIESTDAFRFHLLPSLDRKVKEIPDGSVSNVYFKIDVLMSGYRKFYEPLSHRDMVNLDDYFSSVELEKIDIEDFENKFSRAKKSFSWFFKFIENDIKIPLEYVLREKRDDNR